METLTVMATPVDLVGADSAVIDELLEFRDSAYILAARILNSPDEAEDVLHEAYLKALAVLPSRTGYAVPRPWFLKIVANEAKNHLRSKARRRRREAAVGPVMASGRDDSRGEIIPALRGALASLNEKHRVAISLCYEQGFSQREAAAVMEVAESSVSKYLKEGLERLRRALKGAGYPAAVAALLGGLEQTAPAVPASLASRVEALVARGPAVRPASAARRLAARRGAAKGGFAMKLIAGVLLAGAVAAGVAVVSGGGGDRPELPAAAPSTGPSAGLTQEHYAWASQPAYLDGPRREAWGRGSGPLDEDFNCYVGGDNAGRCIRASDNLIVRFFGNDYATLDFGGDEGPAAFLPRLSPISGTGYGQSIGGLVVIGLPWKGGVENCVYAYSNGGIWRIWKNEEKNGRWWFKRLVGAGKLEIPGGRIYQGQTWRKQGEKEYKAVFFTPAGFYVLEDRPAGARFKCLLALESIKDQFPPVKTREGSRPARPTQGQVDSGGYYYLGYYFSDGYAWKKLPKIQRVLPDGKKVEPWVSDLYGYKKKGKGGPGMKTGWHCGPHFHPPKAVSPWYPPGILLGHAHDEHVLRRVTPDGRVSTLYEDGEWRESSSTNKAELNGVASFVYGANGWALTSSSGEGFSKRRGEGLCLIKGIDMGKASVKKLDE